MFKLLRLMPVVLAFFAIGTTSVDAADASLLLGQTHNYSVHMRSNGEAIITARVVFHNRGTEEQKSLALDIPGSVYEVYALQQVLPRECKRYQGGYYNGDETKCLEFAEPDYTQNYYYYGYGSNREAEYKKITPTRNGTKYTFNLGAAVAEDKSGALIISYASKSYTATSFGSTRFDFESFKADERIKQVKVAVTFDDDVYYEGKQSKVKYAPESTAGISALADTSASNTSLKNYVGAIGNEGVLTKEASSLAPGDSFHVRGTYATSWWALHRAKIIGTVVGLLAVVAAFFLATRWQSKRAKKMPEDEETSQSSNASKPTEKLTTITNTSVTSMNVLGLRVTPLFGSFLYALLSIVGTCIGLFLILLALVLTQKGTDSYSRDGVQTAALILGTAAAVLTALLGMFSLPVLLARRRGLRYLFITVAFQIVWLLIIVLILGLFTGGDSQRSPDYYNSSPAILE